MTSGNSHADSAQLLIQQRYADPSLSLKALSQNLNLSEEHLGRLIKQHAGSSFRRCLLGVRMEKAIALLARSTDAVKTVAYMCGYRYHSHFAQDFREYTGVAPKEFRRLYSAGALVNAGPALTHGDPPREVEMFNVSDTPPGGNPYTVIPIF